MTTTSTTMPYNTRRKSLSLSELGISVPKRARTASHPSPPSTIVEGEEPPVKKSKRSHGSSSPQPMSPPRTTTTSIRVNDEVKTPAQLSPPPSPKAEGANKVDVEGINDDIVVGTIRQIEKTGNRPHLVKELALVLATHLHCVEKYVARAACGPWTEHANRVRRSANPCALISSRLTAYLNRSWPAISPCPLAKDLSSVHPRRLYFFLTTTPHQPIPEVPPPLPDLKRNLSPPQSSASATDEDERLLRQRTALSPSPEVDLSSPDLDDEQTFEPRQSRSASTSHPHKRAASPQLEREERDFKQTANHCFEQAQARRNSQEQPQQDVAMDKDAAGGVALEFGESISMSIEDDERRHHDDAAALFGSGKLSSQQLIDFSSPVIQPQIDTALEKMEAIDEKMTSFAGSHGMALDLPDASILTWGADADVGALQSPESIEVAELEELFDRY